MKNLLKLLTIAVTGLTCPAPAAFADDTEIFNANPSLAATISPPNVLIVVDNTSNWNTQFNYEKTALINVINTLTTNVNVGMMVQSSSGTLDGGYVRFHIRPMDGTNRPALANLVTAITNVSTEKANNPTYAQTLNEAYLYFTGGAPRAGFGDDKRDCGASNTNNPYASPLAGSHGYTGCGSGNVNNASQFNDVGNNTSVTYISPISNTDGCQKTYIIYVSNGPIANNDNAPGLTLLQGVGGNTSVIPVSPNGETAPNYADEWSRFLYNTDLKPGLTGKQNVVTYSINVNPGTTGQGPAHTAMMKSIASQGHGRYCDATDLASLTNCLNVFFNEIQAVNSIFAAVTLPVSVNVRGTNLNQVYIGMFRPDADSLPRWPGNLKQYELAVDVNKNLFLTDSRGTSAPAVVASTGVFADDAVSFWTTTSSFWSFSPSGNPASVDDRPDGAVVEKGGAAEVLRKVHATDQSLRKIYTCVGCSGGTNLATAGTSTVFATGNSSITQAMINPAGGATDKNAIIDWVRGTDNNGDENLNGSTTDIRASIHGDVLHSRPVVVNYNRTGTNDDVYAFYGSNDGLFRAVKGGQLAPSAATSELDAAHSGYENWGFIPEEFFGKFKRMRDNFPAVTSASGLSTQTFTVALTVGSNLITGLSSAQLQSLASGMSVSGTGIPANTSVVGVNTSSNTVTLNQNATVGVASAVTFTPNPKTYFADGPIGSLVRDANGNGILQGGDCVSGVCDTVQLFIAMRRGGSFIYALDVTNPDQPIFLWRKGCYHASNPTGCDTGYGELGQTWSEPKAAKVNVSGTIKDVLIFGGGYDAAVEDQDPVTSTNTMGRAIYIVDAADGSVIWRASPTAAAGITSHIVAGMTYSISSDVTVIDRDKNGRADRSYVGDTGGNVWRVDLNDPSPANWTVNKLASVGYAAYGSKSDRRKFLYPPDVVAAKDSAGNPYDAVLIGSGDREHPFNGYGDAQHPLGDAVQNRYYMFMDRATGLGFIDTTSGGTPSTIVESQMIDVVNNTTPASVRGWYLSLETGEKVVGGSVTLAGATFFNTNLPTPPAPGVCTSNLGEAREYAVDFETGGPGIDRNGDGVITSTDLYTALASGGYLPSPVGLIVNIGGQNYQGVASGGNMQTPPGVTLGKRLRTYWHNKLD
jgi:type IV pilus assembly protein PilY1